VLSTADAAEWRSVLPASVSVTGSVEHVTICEKHTGFAGRLFVAEIAGRTVAYPFFLRPIRALPFADQGVELFDTITPDYTGPLAIGPHAASGKDDATFADVFASYCKANGIVAEFAHLSPWNVANGDIDESKVVFNREIVYVDLSWGEDRIWTESLLSSCRRQVKQARRADVRIRRADSPKDIEEFYRLYVLTMNRRNALDRYYFPCEYFMDFFHGMPNNFFCMLAEFEGRAVAGGVFFHDAVDVHWFVSGADLTYANVRPVNMYLYESLLAMQRTGKKRLLMGGSYHPGDGVFRFKTTFSPLRARFCTYQRIHDPETYGELTRAWSAHHGGAQPSSAYFPAYRADKPDATTQDAEIDGQQSEMGNA